MSHCHEEHIHITIPACADDPRTCVPDPPGVTIHRVPALHPEDVTFVDGIAVTSVSRTLIDLADVLTPAELRAAFTRAREMGLLDIAAVEASFARVEWRPSRAVLRSVINDFYEVHGGAALKREQWVGGLCGRHVQHRRVTGESGRLARRVCGARALVCCRETEHLSPKGQFAEHEQYGLSVVPQGRWHTPGSLWNPGLRARRVSGAYRAHLGKGWPHDRR